MRVILGYAFYTKREVAMLFEVPLSSVRRLIRRGDLHAVKLERTWFISEQAIFNYLKIDPELKIEDEKEQHRT